MRISPLLKKKYPELVVGYAVMRDVKVERRVEALEEEKRRIINEIRSRYAASSISEIPEIKAYRKFYRAMGVDPTKVRPPAEYLLRRIMMGKFPSINNIVDSCLLASVESWAITSVYDLDKIRGTPTVTVAEQEETFQLIDGRMASPRIGEVLLRDDEKILTAYTLGDSRATMVTSQTTNALVVAWNTPGINRECVEKALELAIDYIRRFCQAALEERSVLA